MNNYDSLDILIVALLLGTPLSLCYYLFDYIRRSYWRDVKAVPQDDKNFTVNVFHKGDG